VNNSIGFPAISGHAGREAKMISDEMCIAAARDPRSLKEKV